MKVNLGDGFEFETFELEQARDAIQLATETKGSVYSWKTIGNSNWLEKGLSITDVLAITVLPKGFPESLDLPDDEDG
ncbi:MAG: hypothetical protein ACOYZ6_17175 [Chloroflexota bacterium]